MFDVGWSEMAAIAVIILVVLGPKELPHALKTISHWMRAARKLGNEFQSGVNEIVREAELDDAKRELQKISRGSISKTIEQTIDPSGEVKQALKAAAEVDAPSIQAPAVKAPEQVKENIGQPAVPDSQSASAAETDESAAGSGASAGPSDKNAVVEVIGSKNVSA